MSLSYQKLEPVLVRDPVTILNNKREYAVLKSGSQVTWKAFTTTSISSSSIQFSCPPPSGGIIIDRKQYIQLPVRLTFTGPDNGAPLIQANKDAPRAFPFSSSVDTLQVTINNQSVSINIADIIHGLMHYNIDEKLYGLDYSRTPNYPDQSQVYSNLNGSIRNPLSLYSDSKHLSCSSRGSFPFTIVTNTNTSAVIDMVITEPIFLSPFYWGKHDASGFYNVNTMDFNITFLANAAFRMWSHDNSASSGTATTLSTGSVQFNGFSPAFSYSENQPRMLFKYITPLQTDILPYNMPITYPYFDIQRYPTDFATLNAGLTSLVSSNNIQLNSIPRRMYIFARRNNATLYSSSEFTDTFFSIESMSVQFSNKNGLLASATKGQLYQMSVENHCAMNWNQWSGEQVYNGNLSSRFGTIGSVVCIEFATNIGLDDLDAPGKLGQYQLQVDVNIKNNSSLNIPGTLYLVVVSEGTFTIEGLGKASTNIGVIDSNDILNAKSSPWVDYADIQDVNGGNFLSGLKDFGKDIWKFVRDNKVVSKALGAIPHPYAQAAAPVASALGFGKKDGGVMVGGVPVGGVSMGGRSIDRSMLRKRL